MAETEFITIKNNSIICNENCPTKAFYNSLNKPFININNFINMFNVPFEVSTNIYNSIDLLFIGEAPDSQETLYKRPFYPKSISGLILRNVINDLNVKYYAMANIVSCRPVYLINNKFMNRTPAYNECQYCSCYLKSFMKSLHNDLKVILLGKTAATTLLGETKYNKNYSSITPMTKLPSYKYKNRTYGVNFHPRYVQNGGGVKSKRYREYLERMKEIINT
jgi:uracil-DNA glycosylase family 4